MTNAETPFTAEILQFLPSIDALLRSETAAKLLCETGPKHLTSLARAVVVALRREILEKAAGNLINPLEFSRETLLEEAEKRLKYSWVSEQKTSLQRIINATGVIVHTNLGRAPLSENARKAVIELAGR
jgi:L-seryl-tRNA(Ser) seleniumtransferase